MSVQVDVKYRLACIRADEELDRPQMCYRCVEVASDTWLVRSPVPLSVVASCHDTRVYGRHRETGSLPRCCSIFVVDVRYISPNDRLVD